MFLTDYFVDVTVKRSGFNILDKTFYKDHSIFYTCVRNEKKEVKFENKYNEYKKIFNDYLNYYENLVKQFNEKMKNFA
jgi:hypothetical protein